MAIFNLFACFTSITHTTAIPLTTKSQRPQPQPHPQAPTSPDQCCSRVPGHRRSFNRFRQNGSWLHVITMANVALQLLAACILCGISGYRGKGERHGFLALSAGITLAVVILEILTAVCCRVARAAFERVLRRHCWQERDAFCAGIAFAGAVGSVLVWFFVGGVAVCAFCLGDLGVGWSRW